MRIYDHDAKRTLQRVTLFLTPAEARELADSAADLAEHPEKHHHHISDSAYEREVIIAVHTPENQHQFDADSKRITNEA